MGEILETSSRNSQEWTSPTGVTTTLYTIGELANRLGRTTKAIIKWEIAGNIPKTPFRNANNQRLYSEEHIEAIVKNAEKARIRQGSRISSSSFPRNNLKDFQRLQVYFFGENEENKKPLNRKYKKG